MKANPGLIALSIGAFGIGVTEFAPMGLLPVIAGDLGVSIPTAGLLISAYALGVMLGAPLMTLTTGRVPRRTLLIALAGVFTLGNLLAAISTGYGMLLAARLITSLNHGAFFGVGSIVAASLVPPERKAGAVAAMFMGLTIANVVGVPLATWAGEHLGWRMSFWGISGLGVATMAALRLTLPAMPAPKGGNAIAEMRVLKRGSVLGALALTVIGSSAMFTVFTYIAPILRAETHASLGFVTAMLVTYGVGLTVGNWLRPFGRPHLDGDARRIGAGAGCVRRPDAVRRAHRDPDFSVGRRQLRAGPGASGPRDDRCERRTQPGFGRQYRRVQLGERDWRRDRWRGDRRRIWLSRRRGSGGDRRDRGLGGRHGSGLDIPIVATPGTEALRCLKGSVERFARN